MVWKASSAWVPSILMIGLGVAALYPTSTTVLLAPGVGVHGTPACYALGVALMMGGALLFFRVRAGYYVALAAALATAITGLAIRFGHPTWGLPYNWAISVVVGIYLTLRVLMLIPTAPEESILDRVDKPPPPGDPN